MKCHPICLLFPQMSPEELHDLAEDIRRKGLLHPIIIFGGKILDGRNRYLACRIAGVEPRFVEWKGKGSPLQWVISENMVRRHLTSSQRAVLALELLPLLEKEAHERKRLSPGRGGKNTRRKLRMFSEGNGEAREIAAKMTSTNAAYVQTLKKVSSDAPELIVEVRNGRLTVPEARLLASAPAAIRRKVLGEMDGRPHGQRIARLIRQQQVASRRASARRFADRMPDDGNIIVGDMGLLWQRLEDSSARMFFSDPPYADTEAYERLAELAASKLAPSGWCLAYAGQMRLPEVMEAMGRHLTYFWTFAIQFSGSHCAIHARHVQNRWKPILAFAKPPIKPPADWIVDSLQGGGRAKDLHDWEQPQSEVDYLLRLLSDPGDLVVDPYCGSGTIPAACKALGRQWLATDTDTGAVALTRKRLAEMGGKKQGRRRAG